jgi:prepilin-type N-terminal cleavage/methylation domain-containing protein
MMRSSLIKKNWASGVTLLEVMLVIAIAGSILAMGISQYQSMQRDSNVRQVQANVDTLFNAMAYWYKANCGRAAVGGNTSGYLSPYNP